ncbi:Lrp/AsnC family transcriptional regulator [Haloprofundus salilacus]|uniref:Lrp/AsnC family transcriptional regulator n=1 Tax=Haloprofundus salilacus TaxID=2876190 RepID=UPI001CCA5388|nr:Lrp/AsnC family transcriptional regulator [Haloprofundus salilacus]
MNSDDVPDPGDFAGADPLNERTDTLDRGIIYLLQKNARTSFTDVAAALGVSDNTVRNRIDRLQDVGIIDGYTIEIDYNQTPGQHHYIFICSARVTQREELAEAALDIPGVVEVRTLMTGERNVHIEAVGVDNDDITRIAFALDELGLEVVQEDLIRREDRRPLANFEFEKRD